MKLKISLKKWIAYLLIFAVTLSVIPPVPVFASGDDDIAGSIAGTIQSEAEKTAEAVADSLSSNSAGDWATAVFVDHWYWNSFHNVVVY